MNPFASATVLAGQLRTGKTSALELLDAQLARIDRHGAALNAVVTLDTARARNQAQELDGRRGDSPGMLHGLSATIKDSFETAGLLTTCGAPQWKKHVPAANADAVERLSAAGMIISGKSNVPIYAGDVQPTTCCSARPTIPGICHAPAGARPAAQPQRWRRGSALLN